MQQQARNNSSAGESLRRARKIASDRKGTSAPARGMQEATGHSSPQHIRGLKHSDPDSGKVDWHEMDGTH